MTDQEIIREIYGCTQEELIMQLEREQFETTEIKKIASTELFERPRFIKKIRYEFTKKGSGTDYFDSKRFVSKYQHHFPDISIDELFTLAMMKSIAPRRTVVMMHDGSGIALEVCERFRDYWAKFRKNNYK